MRAIRLGLVAVMLTLLPATAAASASSPPFGDDYHSPDITRNCGADTPNFRSLWRTTFNGVRVDLYCGDRLLVGDDGRCWTEYGGRIEPARCTEP